jgi:short-subunit dehydrogenase
MADLILVSPAADSNPDLRVVISYSIHYMAIELLYTVITGATGGIGKSFARQLAEKKHNLILTDLNAPALAEMAAQLSADFGVAVRTEALDLSDAGQVVRLCDRWAVSDEIGGLVHCAGFGEGVCFHEEPVGRKRAMMQVHIGAAVELVHAVLPGMIRRRKGVVVMVSSLAAFLPAPGSSLYAATKAFLHSFIESIHMEVRMSGIRVQSLCPGITRTGFHEKMHREKKRSHLAIRIPQMDADNVVRISLRCLDKGKVVCIPGWFNQAVKRVVPLIPRQLFYWLSTKIGAREA